MSGLLEGLEAAGWRNRARGDGGPILGADLLIRDRPA